MSETHAPPQGLIYSSLEAGATTDALRDYAMSKVGNWYLGVEAAARWGAKHGIVSVVQNPGNLNTRAYRTQPVWVQWVLRLLVLYEPRLGACTMLFAGFTDQVGVEVEQGNGVYVVPFGVVRENGRKDLYGRIGEGKAGEFWEWCEGQYGKFV